MSKSKNSVRHIPHITAAAAVVPAVADAAAAFHATAGARAALSPSELATANLDVGAAALMGIGTVARCAPFSDQIRPLCTEVPAAFDHLLEYAHAAAHANDLWLHSREGTDEVQRLTAEGAPLRVKILSVLEHAAAFELCDGAVIDGLRAGSGHRDLADDLCRGADVIDGLWEKLQGRVLLERADLANARKVGTHLRAAVGVRDTGTPPAVATIAETRQRAFTLLARAYEEVRRVVHFLRWYRGDADELAPSLWTRPGAGRRPAVAADAPAEPARPATPPAPAAPAVQEAAAPAPAAADIGVEPGTHPFSD